MELIEQDDIQYLFMVDSVNNNLCRWRNKTYLCKGNDLYSLTIEETIQIEMYYKHLAGIAARPNRTLFLYTPTLKLTDLLRDPRGGLYDRAIVWWVNNVEAKDYSRDKKPVAVWRRDRPVQQV